MNATLNVSGLAELSAVLCAYGLFFYLLGRRAVVRGRARRRGGLLKPGASTPTRSDSKRGGQLERGTTAGTTRRTLRAGEGYRSSGEHGREWEVTATRPLLAVESSCIAPGSYGPSHALGGNGRPPRSATSDDWFAG